MYTKLLILLLSFTIGLMSFAQNDSSFQSKELIKERKGTGYTIITHNEIEANYGKTLAGLLNEQAGIVVNGAYQPMGSLINIYMDGYLGGKVLIQIDGLPVGDPASIAENYFDLSFIPLNLIEEIIIKHSSHSTVDGSGAIAGVINIITRKKEVNKKLNIKGEIGAANRNTRSSNIQLWGVLKKLRYQINYTKYSTKGFSDATDTTGKNNFDNDGFKNSVLNTSLEYKVNNFKVYSYLLYSKYRAASDGDDYLDAKNFYYKNSFVNTGVECNYTKNNLFLTFNYKYSNVTRDYYDSIYNLEKILGLFQLVSVRANYIFSKRFNLNGGIEYRHIQLKDFYTNNFYNSIPNKYPIKVQYGAFGTLSYTSSDTRYHATAGYRIYNYNQGKLNDCYALSSSYQISKSTTAFTSINCGYQTPSIYASSDSSVGNKTLKSEQGINYQIGIDWKTNHWENKCLLLNNNMNNGIEYNYNTGAYANFNSLQSWGIEYETLITFCSHFKVSGNYTFLTGKESTISRQNFSDTISYGYLIRRPKHTLNCKLTYQTVKGNYISLSGRYVSNYYDAGTSIDDYKMKGFLVLNLNASLELHKYCKLNMGIQNLANSTFHDTRGYNSIPLLFIISSYFVL